MPWPDIVREVNALPYGTELEFQRSELPSPTDYGATRSYGLPRGQEADYRFPPSADGSGIHVRAYKTTYRVHRDRVHPGVSLIGHFFADVVRSPNPRIVVKRSL